MVEVLAKDQFTEKMQVFNWNDDMEKSFVSLKRALTEALVLCYPDQEAHLVLDTDASAHGIGAVLSQLWLTIALHSADQRRITVLPGKSYLQL